MPQETNMIQQIMQNYITWVFMFIGGIWAFVVQIILPINTIQNQLVTIQSQLVTIQGYDKRITKNASDILVIQQDLTYLMPQKK